jgi:hypothetical protein
VFSCTEKMSIQVKEMKNLQLRFILSAVTLSSFVITGVLSAIAAPVKFGQVRQVVNPKPGKASTGSFSHLRLAGGGDVVTTGENKGGDDKTKNAQGDDTTPTAAPTPPEQPPVQQDNSRVIVETTSDIVDDDACECVQPDIVSKGFNGFPLLGLGAIPFLFLIPHGNDTPTPTPTLPITETPTTTPTTTPTPPTTPTPTPPEPVPEPMTILLFGTGLASVGRAARKRLGKKDKGKTAE